MAKGIVFGLLYQVTSAIGFILISNVTVVKSNVLKASLALCSAGILASVLALYFFSSGTEHLSVLTKRNLLYLILGAIFSLFLGQILYITGLFASNLTTIAYTALAYPAVALIMELTLGRVRLATLTVRDFGGLALLIAGFLLLMSRR